MPILDSQVHAYERNHPGRPWSALSTGPAEVTGDQMVAAMDEVGVDGAILVSPFSMYRYDASYALEVTRRTPAGSGWSSRSIRPIPPWSNDRRLGFDRGHGRHPDILKRQRFDRSRRPGDQSRSCDRGAAFTAGQHGVHGAP